MAILLVHAIFKLCDIVIRINLNYCLSGRRNILSLSEDWIKINLFQFGPIGMIAKYWKAWKFKKKTKKKNQTQGRFSVYISSGFGEISVGSLIKHKIMIFSPWTSRPTPQKNILYQMYIPGINLYGFGSISFSACTFFMYKHFVENLGF